VPPPDWIYLELACAEALHFTGLPLVVTIKNTTLHGLYYLYYYNYHYTGVLQNGKRPV